MAAKDRRGAVSMDAMPLVSVVVPAYNAAGSIGETLNALRGQAYRQPFEIIVVDNASTDDTAAVAASYGATVLRERKRGPSAARNCGLRAARGEIVAHLDADTLPSRRWLRDITEPFSDPDVRLVAGNTLCYPPKTAAERYVQASKLYDTERAIKREEFPFAPSLNLAVRRSAALAVGGWDEDMPTGEDVDFSHRILTRFATNIAYAPGAVLYHHTRADAGALCKQAWTYGEGAGQLYLRYPDELRWDVRKSAVLAIRLLDRCSRPPLCALGRALGIVPGEQLEFVRYQSLWDRHFWAGFFHMYLLRRRRFT